MPGASYLIRFDDICPTMNWSVWNEVEAMLTRQSIKPILAVVPDNQDAMLAVAEPRADFWDRVRGWQTRGWSIGLHGWQHRYSSREAGIVGINARSEFAGLGAAEQATKLDAALKVFRRERVRADCWIAPGHSFDWETVRLLRARGVDVVSDGYFARPVRWRESSWVPQQLWRFRRMPAGVWTVCFHHNNFAAPDIARLQSDLEKFRHHITDLNSVLASAPDDCGITDRLWAAAWRSAVRLKRSIG